MYTGAARLWHLIRLHITFLNQRDFKNEYQERWFGRLTLSCSGSFKLSSFGSNTEPQTLLEFFIGGPQALQRGSVPLQVEQSLQRLQTFLRINRPLLQNGPKALVHRV